MALQPSSNPPDLPLESPLNVVIACFPFWFRHPWLTADTVSEGTVGRGAWGAWRGTSESDVHFHSEIKYRVEGTKFVMKKIGTQKSTNFTLTFNHFDDYYFAIISRLLLIRDFQKDSITFFRFRRFSWKKTHLSPVVHWRRHYTQESPRMTFYFNKKTTLPIYGGGG